MSQTRLAISPPGPQWLARSITTYVGSLAVISAMAGWWRRASRRDAPLLILTVDALGFVLPALIFVSAASSTGSCAPGWSRSS